jgi:hypothetical protein
MSGETRATLMATIMMDRWWHVSSPDRLIVNDAWGDKFIALSKRSREEVKGVILYADVADKSIEMNNYDVVIDANLPCWPNPKTLKRMISRFNVLEECIHAGFVDHNVYMSDQFVPDELFSMMPLPLVLKLGNVHRGEGKWLLNSRNDLPSIIHNHPDPGIFSIEPFFKGTSIRSLIIGDDTFGIRVENDRSWIKNSEGADVYEHELSQSMIDHSRSVAKHFGLEIAGVDYIVNVEGEHFLEINYCPGITGFENIERCAKSFFMKKMREVEAACK